MVEGLKYQRNHPPVNLAQEPLFLFLCHGRIRLRRRQEPGGFIDPSAVLRFGHVAGCHVALHGFGGLNTGDARLFPARHYE